MAHWSEDAACTGTPWEAWYPPSGAGNVTVTRAAVAICTPCPVRAACLDAAMAEEADAGACYRAGIRGGLTAAQRAELAAASQ